VTGARNKIVFAIALLLAPASAARAQQVYPGCMVPPTKFNHVWYIDPVNGTTPAAGGNGSRAAPWNSLPAVFAATTGYTYPLLTTAPYRQAGAFVPGPLAGPIAPGDEILLMNGNYGAMQIGVYQGPINNPQFVTIAAAPGQTPFFTSLGVSGSSGFAFEGIKVQKTVPTQSGSVINVSSSPGYPTSNIVLSNMNVSNADPSVYMTWTAAQWEANTGVGINLAGEALTTCVSVVNSTIQATHFGVNVFAYQVLVDSNEIKYFGDDGIDYSGNHLRMTRNYIHDGLNYTAAHWDGFQGYSPAFTAPALYGTYTDMVIDSNRILRQADPANPMPAPWIDGIDNYGMVPSQYDGMTITNNAIITSGCNGIVFNGLTNSTVANNTVIDDGSAVNPTCVPGIRITDYPGTPILNSNDRIFNNYGALGVQNNATNNVTFDHDVIPHNGGPNLAYQVLQSSGTWAFGYLATPGQYGDGTTLIDAGGPASEFTIISPSTLTWNLTPLPGSQVAGAGTSVGAPLTDIAGAARAVPVGAWAF
jgi:hypothetical protein